MSQDEDRVDWWEVIQALRRAGLSIGRQARLVGASKSALIGLRNLDAEPRYIRGERLLLLFAERCPGRSVPRQKSRAVYRIFTG